MRCTYLRTEAIIYILYICMLRYSETFARTQNDERKLSHCESCGFIKYERKMEIH